MYIFTLKKWKLKKRFSVILLSFLIFYYLLRILFKCNCDEVIVVNKSFKKMPQSILTEDTIYFLETTNTDCHVLTAREACSIESAGVRLYISKS